MDDTQYWQNFYKLNRFNDTPSSFAFYVSENYLKKSGQILELGCGNGRDAIFFGEQLNFKVTALDLADEEIDFLNSKKISNVSFISQDFTDLSEIAKVDYIYSRFTLHSIDEVSEDTLFSQLNEQLNDGGLLLFEARSSKDEKLNKVYGKNHYRRYLDYNKTLEKIINLGFKIIESTESQGLAIYKDEDPFVLRIIAQKIS